MERLQTNGILELTRSMVQKNLNSLTETVRVDKNEQSGFRRELEEQTKAVKNDSSGETEEPKNVENTETVEGKSGGVIGEDVEETLENELAVMQQLIAAGVVNFTPMENKVVPRQDTAAVAVDPGARVELTEAAKGIVDIRFPEQGMRQPETETAAQMPIVPVQTGEEPAVEGEAVPLMEASVQSEAVAVELQQPELRQDMAQTENGEAAPQGAEEREFEVTDAAESAQPVFENVDEIPVKVGETTAPEQTTQTSQLTWTMQTAPVEEQVEVKLSEALQQGESKVEIRLNPEYLGSVKVELTHSEDGTLHVVLSAENSQTGTLLEKHSSNLQNLLMTGGQERVQVEVQNTQEHQQNQQNLADGHNGNPQQEQQRQPRRDTQDTQAFLQQLRLGLIPLDEEEEDS